MSVQQRTYVTENFVHDKNTSPPGDTKTIMDTYRPTVKMARVFHRFKAIMKWLIRYTYYVTGTSTQIILKRKSSFIIMYHGVDGVIDRIDDLESQLLYLKDNFLIVPIESLTSGKLNSNGEIRVAITFDDGLKNNYTNVAPLLAKHNIPATFFVCPSLIDSNTWLWNHESRSRLNAMDENDRLSIYSEHGISGSSTEDVINWMKNQSIDIRKEVENSIRAHTPSFVPTEAQHMLYDLMSWSDLISLPNLINISSHSSSHPILTSLERNDLRTEIVDSKYTLERKLNRSINYFCYPNGSYNSEVLALVKIYYKAAVTAEAGYIKYNDNQYLLKRIAATPNMGIASFAWRLHRAN